MKEPKRIKLNPETPTPKEVTKHRLDPLNKTEWDTYGQDNDDIYTPIDLDKINRLLDESNENNSQDH
jgi:hypothetical protein